MTQDFDFLFAKSKLPKDTIDLGIGESNLLREAVLEAYNLKNISFDELPNIFEYAPPYGYEPLVEKLESIYGAKIVVTQSAKHALAACFFAMKASGKNKIHYRKPYWSSIPSLVTREGLDYSHLIDGCDCQLIISPGNPDGWITFDKINETIPLIHDGAYFTNSYTNTNITLPFIDLQIFSVAKMYGLSGLRTGWILVNNPIYYDYLTKFVEATTAGVSTVSQAVLLHILNEEQKNPQIRIDYEFQVKEYLNQNRKYVFENLDYNKFGISEYDRSFQKGMFAWIKSKTQDFSSVGVNVMGGAAFGDPSMIRLNLAVSMDKIIKAVNRMNQI